MLFGGGRDVYSVFQEDTAALSDGFLSYLCRSVADILVSDTRYLSHLDDTVLCLQRRHYSYYPILYVYDADDQKKEQTQEERGE